MTATPDRFALVTGTSTGIGAALAAALLEEGWQVLGAARRGAPIDHGAYGHVEVDLGDPAALERFVADHVRPAFGAPGLSRVALVNNAARIGDLGRITDFTAGGLAAIMAVNVAAPIRLMGAVLAATPAATPLRVVNVSSGAAHMAIPGLVDYCASKAGLLAAGRSTAAELAGTDRDVGIFSYEPGMVATPMQDAARETDPERFPSHGFFTSAHREGALEDPSDVIVPIVDYLAGTPAELFTEARYGAE